MMKIGVIDTGLKKTYKGKKNQFSGYKLEYNGKELIKTDEFEDENGHGTIVASILDKVVADCQICCVKIDSRSVDMFGFDIWLIEALNYFAQAESFDVINISCGLTVCSNVHSLNQICSQLFSKGTIIVAAFDNDGKMSYPACLKTVIGVDSDDKYHNIRLYDYIDDIVNIKSASMVWDVTSIGEREHKVRGNSFNTPYFSGIIVNFLKNGVTKEDVKKELIINACKHSYNTDCTPALTFDKKIQKAIVFPFNKEIHSIARFESIVDFEVTDYFDYPFSKNVGKCVGDLICCDNNKIVKNKYDINWEGGFDTVILSHCYIIDKLSGKDIIKSIIEDCLKHGKNLYMFDELYDIISDYSSMFFKAGLWITCPINNSYIHPQWGAKLYANSSTVICVAGTDSKQGKFTLQILLRMMLKKAGYRVKNFGTEPVSTILGLEGVYTTGYGATMEYQGWKNVIAINQAFHQVDEESPDFVITGLQGRCVMYDKFAINGYPIKQQEFLMATCPDLFILCINTKDETMTVKRSIQYLESVCGSTVACLCVNDTIEKLNVVRTVIIRISNWLRFRKKTYFITRLSPHIIKSIESRL